MKVIAINGSPRKNANTATLLRKALEGASSQGAETELINLYDFNYKGCISCFACKRIGGKSYGKCAINDDLTPIFKKIEEADALIFGSPIYFGDTTGAIRSFMERLMFPYAVYEENYPSLFKKKISTGFIYTMNISDDYVDEAGYKYNFKITENFMRNIFGSSESLLVTDTYQFDDYSKYVSTVWNEEKKAKRREEEFPNDCKKAFEMGVRFAQ
ncbi:NADPH-dependent FMN reductase family protein [Clostridium argentinense CDC 2741]|uniref:NADPH-dependent FMN reductase family protein n=1 Tax=Clostridium argentinense CDC 2741 TaxID=1418104 RepID=A0A0C1UBK6_9CLOT|nr:flavodoxin family protein [Clostridium argentinense]ARC86317.1 flavodoxin [Clostridium argentinense]KIE44935.1 NADPH-dependent FMN reductase family protein [Clostridium argentinense CDC 2741]NFF40619.1 flavodoxin family protein [Clostridium argentinense]NFP51142.1 flavodoxin family protein [Clostridium argentinense]NFP73260.1 flavodoxin family protein [Clostridium argentinense]